MGLDLTGPTFAGNEISIALLLGEFLIGVVMALSIHFASASLHMLGQLIDIQLGVSASATFDPTNHQSSGISARLFSMLAIAIFFGTNLHYQFFFGLAEFFRAMPPGGQLLLTKYYLVALGKIFTLCFILAGPVIIVMFLTDVGLALVSRSMPQAQIYFVSLPLKILIGMLILSSMLSSVQNMFYEVLHSSLTAWEQLGAR